MWTEENTAGFSQSELDTINKVLKRLMEGNDGIEESNLDDAITNEWLEGMTEEELYQAVVKRLGISG